MKSQWILPKSTFHTYQSYPYQFIINYISTFWAEFNSRTLKSYIMNSQLSHDTAIPAFIGYTEKGPTQPTRISSIGDYKTSFGGRCDDEIGVFEIDTTGKITAPPLSPCPKYRMYYMLEMFFANGGGDCFIVSVGNYNSIHNNEMLAGLRLLNE